MKLRSVPGRRAELILSMGGDDSDTVPGCRSFIVAEDASDADVLWITEVWESREAHEKSLKTMPAREGVPPMDELIAGYEKVATTLPVAGSSRPLHGDGRLTG